MPSKQQNNPKTQIKQPKMTSQELTQKAAGYLLAASNAAKSESKGKK
jgi:hypothetical protein